MDKFLILLLSAVLINLGIREESLIRKILGKKKAVVARPLPVPRKVANDVDVAVRIRAERSRRHNQMVAQLLMEAVPRHDVQSVV